MIVHSSVNHLIFFLERQIIQYISMLKSNACYHWLKTVLGSASTENFIVTTFVSLQGIT